MRVLSKILVILVIIALCFTGFYFYKKYYKKEDISLGISKNVDWKKAYLEILKEKDNFKEFDDIELGLYDLDNNDVPELIVIGEKEDDSFGAKIYIINNENKVDTVKFELEDEFSFKFLHNNSKETYNWYVVTEKNKKVYELEAKDKEYNIKLSKYDYSEDFENISNGKTISYDIEDSADTVFEKLEKSYVKTKDLIPEKEEDKNKTNKNSDNKILENNTNSTNKNTNNSITYSQLISNIKDGKVSEIIIDDNKEKAEVKLDGVNGKKDVIIPDIGSFMDVVNEYMEKENSKTFIRKEKDETNTSNKVENSIISNNTSNTVKNNTSKSNKSIKDVFGL